MELKHKDNAEKGSFKLKDGDFLVAEISYVWSNDELIIIDHTGVNSLYEGKGFGKQLVEETVNFARSRGIKILPLCPFAKLIFDRTDKFDDVRFLRQ
ncbi:MAG: N-acetyltransferase [Prevotellaceae bacterium]|jgi:predicted GNAT family acetyltransferase|nr:N-acetyltransferase [Prevotellaceae bacterium]